jgi:hypothetical protein
MRDVELTILSGEQRLAAQHLGQDAPNTPHINGLGVLLEGQHDLGGSVPSSRDIFRHETGVILCTGRRSGESEITDFEIAVGIQKQV